MTDDRERDSRLAANLQREAELILGRWRWPLASRRRRQARAEAAERTDRAEEHRRRAARAHEQLRELGNSGRHLYPWFERHQDVLARGMAAELTLDAAQGAVYHVVGAPGMASLTAACLTTDRPIDVGRLERLVKKDGEARQRLLFEVAAELYGRKQGVSLSELLAELDGEDLDRVLEAIAVVKRRPITSAGSRATCGYAPPNLTSRNVRRVDRSAIADFSGPAGPDGLGKRLPLSRRWPMPELATPSHPKSCTDLRQDVVCRRCGGSSDPEWKARRSYVAIA